MKINDKFVLSDTEIEDFLRAAKIIRVATHGPGERISLAWYCRLRTDEGRFGSSGCFRNSFCRRL